MKRAELISSEVARLYRSLDAGIGKAVAASGYEPTCRIGCSSCCHIMNMASVPEAIHTLVVARAKGTAPTSEKIRADFNDAIDPTMTSNKWFREKRRPCPLLGTDGTCQAYEARPTACRIYYVVSSPTNCRWDADDHRVGALNTYPLQDKAVMTIATSHIFKITRLPSLGISPWQVALYIAQLYIDEGITQAIDEMKRLGIDDDSKTYARWAHYRDEEMTEQIRTNRLPILP